MVEGLHTTRSVVGPAPGKVGGRTHTQIGMGNAALCCTVAAGVAVGVCGEVGPEWEKDNQKEADRHGHKQRHRPHRYDHTASKSSADGGAHTDARHTSVCHHGRVRSDCPECRVAASSPAHPSPEKRTARDHAAIGHQEAPDRRTKEKGEPPSRKLHASVSPRHLTRNDEEFLRWYFAELDGTPQHQTGAPIHNRALERKLSSKETAFRDVTDGEDPSGFQFLPTSDEIHEHAGNYRSAVYLHLNEHHHHEFIKEGHVKGKRGNSGACKLRACRPACVHARVLVRSVGACLPMPWHLSVTRGSEIGHRESFCASSFD